MRSPEFTIEQLRPWLSERFDASSKPGGQNVNKVATRVTLMLDLANCTAFSDAQRDRLQRALSNRLDRDGRLQIVAQEARSQPANRRAAEERLLALITTSLLPRKRRIKTRPTRGAQERRLQTKRQRGETKRLRRLPPE